MQLFYRRSALGLCCLALTLASPALAQPDDSQDDSAANDEGDEEGGDEVAPVPGDPAPPAGAPSEAASEEEGAEEEGEDGEESPSRPPAAGNGVVWGVVQSGRNAEPLMEAGITVVQTGQKLLTDLDGRFRFEAKPGVYTLRVHYEYHLPERIERVEIVRGQVRRLDVTLQPDQTEEEVVEVRTKADTSTIEGQMLQRQKAVATGDGIGRAEIAKNPDSNAAQAASRVVGANIVDRFVYVRGLGERYSNALLNGLPLPSPVPDRAAVPLDLFPALVLDSLTISKTFTPDVPADFAGGSVRIVTRDAPDEFLFSVSGSLGYRTGTTFVKRLDHRGGSTDWLGLDSGIRSLAGSIPTDYSTVAGVEKSGVDPNAPAAERFVDEEDLSAWGRDLNSYMSTTKSRSPFNHGLSIVAGNGWRLGGEQKLGAIVALSFTHGYQRREELSRDFLGKDPNTGVSTVWTDYRVERGGEAVRSGALGNIVYEANRDHQLRLVALGSHMGDKTTSILQGFNANNGSPIHNTHLEFVTQSLTYLQLGGSHRLDTGKSLIDWSLSTSRATREQPDTRDTVFSYNPGDDNWTYVNNSSSGRHFFSEQTEDARSAALDFTQELRGGDKETNVKVGGMVNVREREFQGRRFSYRVSPFYGCVGAELEQSCLDQLFVPENIGLDAAGQRGLLTMTENTEGSDSYEADLDVYAVYLMANVRPVKPLLLSAGERVEFTRQTLETTDPLNLRVSVPGARLKETDLLPAVLAKLDLASGLYLRGSGTRTLARPQLRELAPFAFSDYFGGALSAGNPDLELTHITNWDLRLEYFPTLAEVLALSLFAKQFDKPIERVQIPGSSQNISTFRNSKAANLLGIELEARKSLAFMDPALRYLAAGGNITLARSRVDIAQTGAGFITNLERPLTNQAPYIVNAWLDYENPNSGSALRLLYNVNGPSIVEVGLGGADDSYEHPRHRVDATLSQELGEQLKAKLTAENLLNAPFVVTEGKERTADNVARRYLDGVRLTLGASYTF